MLEQLTVVRDNQDQAKLQRKKGDAFRNRGDERRAMEAYRLGVSVLNEALEMLDTEKKVLEDMTTPNDLAPALSELVEVFGARGGMFERLESLEEALASYAEGAKLEKKFSLPSTYNRLNEIKYTLLIGKKRLSELEPQIQELATHLMSKLQASSQEPSPDASLSGWAWADLGDCWALLGNTEEARNAYATFIMKAEIKSPERTLDVLKKIATKMEEANDSGATRLQSAIGVLQQQLLAP